MFYFAATLYVIGWFFTLAFGAMVLAASVWIIVSDHKRSEKRIRERAR